MQSHSRDLIGAWVEIEWLDEPGTYLRYFSFSDPDHWESDPQECDAFGVPDDEVFFYTTLGELGDPEGFLEFRVLGFELAEA